MGGRCCAPSPATQGCRSRSAACCWWAQGPVLEGQELVTLCSIRLLLPMGVTRKLAAGDSLQDIQSTARNEQ